MKKIYRILFIASIGLSIIAGRELYLSIKKRESADCCMNALKLQSNLLKLNQQIYSRMK